MYTLTTAGYFVSKKFAHINRSPFKNKCVERSLSPSCGKKLILNVSGFKYHIHESVLDDYPETLLGNRKSRKSFYDPVENEYFIDHDPHIFRFIHKYYMTGKLHFPESECHEAFTEELNYFQIELTEIATCCRKSYAIFIINKIGSEVKNDNQEQANTSKDTPSNNAKEKSCRQTCWSFTEEPNTSFSALIFYYVSCTIIVLSVVVNCVETVDCPDDLCHPVTWNNGTCVYSKKCGDLYQDVFFILDTFCVVYFCVEYIIRLYGAPNRFKFVTCKMGLIDLLAVLPYFIDLTMEIFFTKQNNATKYIEMLRSCRIIRVFKLVRHSARLKNLVSSITGSISELGFILFIYFVVVIVFASIIFYAEGMGNEGESVFRNIPEAIWYTVVTTTTLGYGDVVPCTIQGKLIGSFCCLIGVIVIALPVPIIQMKSQTLVSGDI